MQISLSSYSALSRLLGEQSMSSTQASGQTASEEQTPLQRALRAMTSAMEEDAEDRKARARMRLDDAEAQLEYLRRWGFDPAVVAQQAAALGQTVSTAASEFTSALSDTGVMIAEAGTVGNDAAPGTSAAAEAGAEPADDEAEEQSSSTERAYRDMMEDTKGTLSWGDRKTLEEFKAVAQEIKALLDEAVRKLREQKSGDKAALADAQSASTGLDTLIGGLSATTAGAVTAQPSVSISLTL